MKAKSSILKKAEPHKVKRKRVGAIVSGPKAAELLRLKATAKILKPQGTKSLDDKEK